MMRTPSYLDWPFFEDSHRALVGRLSPWAEQHVSNLDHAEDVDAECRRLVGLLGRAGWLKHCIGETAKDFDARAICLLREGLAFHNGLADFVLAMQGLGSGALSLFGTPEQRERYLPGVANGDLIAALALSEPEAGSDVAAMTCTAERDGEGYRLNGVKTWISNGGIADFYCVFARTAPAELRPNGAASARGISAFVVENGVPGFEVTERMQVIAPHPLARLEFNECHIPAGHRIGEEGAGFHIAMQTLDVFRTSVAAAALGFARRALHEALAHCQARRLFGQTLADFQLTQAALADMTTAIDSAALLTYRAAWQRDQGYPVTKEAAMAKMSATESAQQVIDRAVQMFGGRGVVQGEIVEQLYREIRALRIYEGATEIQKLIISRELLKASAKGIP